MTGVELIAAERRRQEVRDTILNLKRVAPKTSRYKALVPLSLSPARVAYPNGNGKR